MPVLWELKRVEDACLSLSASAQYRQFLHHCWTVLEHKAMNQHLTLGSVHMLYFCKENMSFFPDAKVGKAQSRLMG